MKKNVAFLLACSLVVSTFFACENEDDEWEQKVLEYRENKRITYVTENEKYADYEVDVAFLGDSLTDGYDVAKYYPQYLVSNRGIGGDTTVDLEGRIQYSLYDLKPKIAVLLIGANNMGEMFDNYERILQGFQTNVPNTRIILLSLTSMSGEWGKKNQLAAYNNVKIKMLAEKYSFSFVDLYSPLMNLESGEIYPEYTTDGGHLTSRGYEVLTGEITPEIERQMAIWMANNNQ